MSNRVVTVTMLLALAVVVSLVIEFAVMTDQQVSLRNTRESSHLGRYIHSYTKHEVWRLCSSVMVYLSYRNGGHTAVSMGR